MVHHLIVKSLLLKAAALERSCSISRVVLLRKVRDWFCFSFLQALQKFPVGRSTVSPQV